MLERDRARMNQSIQNVLNFFSIKNVMNAKLSETQILRELSMLLISSLNQIESYLIESFSSLFELESSTIQVESSLIQLKSSLILK